jgi:hypothetical protein
MAKDKAEIVNFFFVSFRFVFVDFVSFSLISFRFVPFLFRFALYRYPNFQTYIYIYKYIYIQTRTDFLNTMILINYNPSCMSVRYSTPHVHDPQLNPSRVCLPTNFQKFKCHIFICVCVRVSIYEL